KESFSFLPYFRRHLSALNTGSGTPELRQKYGGRKIEEGIWNRPGRAFLFFPYFCLNLLMPITCPISLAPMSQEEFAQVDYRVMRHAFDSQNELSRLCDEVIYHNDLAARLESAGLS